MLAEIFQVLIVLDDVVQAHPAARAADKRLVFVIAKIVFGVGPQERDDRFDAVATLLGGRGRRLSFPDGRWGWAF